MAPGPAWLILPTYDEAENLEPLVDAVLPVLAAAAPEGHRILIVDDNSPDGTGAIADRLAAELAEVEVLHRPAAEGRSEEHTSELQSRQYLVCRLLLEKKNIQTHSTS